MAHAFKDPNARGAVLIAASDFRNGGGPCAGPAISFDDAGWQNAADLLLFSVVRNDGLEITGSKRFSRRWQMLAGLTLGRNYGGVAAGDLNDPNNARNFPRGIEGTDSEYAFRLSGSYTAPYEISVSGSFILNDGYPYQSQHAVTRTAFPTLTRASQTVRLTERGDERLPDVTMVDLRVSRTFRLGTRRITPLLEVFNLGNADTFVGYNNNVGTSYLRPTDILSPRIARMGITVHF